MPRFFCCLFLLFSFDLFAQSLDPQPYTIDSSNLQEVWVDRLNGNDGNSGSSSSNALRTVAEAWNRIPQNSALAEGFRLNLRAGTYPRSELPNYWENRIGTANAPIIFNAVDGDGTVIFQGDINAFNVEHFYVLGLEISPSPAGDAFHCENCEHVLLRNVHLDGGNRQAHETLKVNQSQHFYIENSLIHGADDNAIDFVAVQYGHIINSRIHDAQDWCTYLKGGSAYISFVNNTVHNCGTGGVTAGQGTGLEFMQHPWLRYEAQNIKIFNNVIYDTEGAALGVNGGLDILIAYNTAYGIGSRSHVFESVFGLRSCDGNNPECASRVAATGWGPSNSSIAEQSIPNKNVLVYNNIFYNPPSVVSQWEHFAIYGPRTPTAGTNIPSPAHTDENLQIKGNVVWNGPSDHSLGIGDPTVGCPDSNTSCNAAQVLAENSINQIEPQLINPEAGDFRPVASSNLFSATTFNLSDFAPTESTVIVGTPLGERSNTIVKDRSGVARADSGIAGAYLTNDGEQNPGIPDVDSPTTGNQPPDITLTLIRPGYSARVGRMLRLQATVTDDDSVLRVRANIRGLATKNLQLRSGNLYGGRFRLTDRGRYRMRLIAIDNEGLRTVLRLGALTVN